MMLPDRKAPRLKNFDYSRRNYYFITICTHDKTCIFGDAGKLNDLGRIAEQDIRNISLNYSNISVDNYVVMPNHIHAIIAINDDSAVNSISKIIGLYKSGVTRKIREVKPGINVWQRSFHDHIIRKREEYEKIWNYVEHNEQKWAQDCFYIRPIL